MKRLPDQAIIAVLQGGPGSEREISLASAASVEEALREKGYQVVGVDVQGDDFALPPEVTLAFNVIHGTFGEDGQLQRLLEARGLPYTGAGAASSERAFDKIDSKEVFEKAGVPTPRWETLEIALSQPPNLPVPCVIKPPREGSSVGVHIVKDERQIPAALADVGRFSEVALVEEFVPGKELTVGIVGQEVLPIVHIQPQDGFYDMKNKYPWLQKSGGGSDYIVPADLPAELTQAVQAAAKQAHDALGVEVYSRVDVLLPEEGGPSVLEVNTIPGMTSTSLLPKAAGVVGYSFGDLCQRIAELSFTRFFA
ncbi:MAG: D-alanine--D-alanine ligase [Verrucomicrobiota bacterium]